VPVILRPSRTAAVVGVSAAILLTIAGVSARYVAMAEGNKSPDDPVTNRGQVEQIVREYLLEHPELLVEVMGKLDEKEDAARQAASKDLIAKNRAQLNNDGYSYVAGNQAGDVTVIEFFDYNCGYCKKVRPSLLKLIEEDKGVRLVLKEFPVLHDRQPGSMVAARAATAAVAQGEKYWGFHNEMLGHDGAVTEATVFELAGKAGLDVERLKRDMADPSIDQRIEQNHKLAENMKIDGTPSFIIGDAFVPGAVDIDELKRLVAEARAKCETCAL
jgi:protein-disulfide isomerase